MLISIYTNEVQGGWKPQDIAKFLGGGEESIVLFSSALKELGYDVEVYSSIVIETEFNGVRYKPRHSFDFEKKYETLITWKDSTPWKLNVQAGKKIHWSSDVETPWANGVLSKIDSFVCFSTYHLSRNSFAGEKGKVIQLGIGLNEENKQPKRKKTILYCSSPDRGLTTLLNHWGEVEGYELIITYGKMFPVNLPNVKQIGTVDKDTFEKLLWSCSYWVHTLNNPDAELFCLNAIKARATNTTAIINTVEGSGLTDTVSEYVPFKNFLRGDMKLHKNDKCCAGIRTWDGIVTNEWKQLLGN